MCVCVTWIFNDHAGHSLGSNTKKMQIVQFVFCYIYIVSCPSFVCMVMSVFQNEEMFGFVFRWAANLIWHDALLHTFRHVFVTMHVVTGLSEGHQFISSVTSQLVRQQLIWYSHLHVIDCEGLYRLCLDLPLETTPGNLLAFPGVGKEMSMSSMLQ